MIKEYLDKNPQIKTVVYIVLGIVGLNVVGKIFSVWATSVRGFHDFWSAINGK